MAAVTLEAYSASALHAVQRQGSQPATRAQAQPAQVHLLPPVVLQCGEGQGEQQQYRRGIAWCCRLMRADVSMMMHAHVAGALQLHPVLVMTMMTALWKDVWNDVRRHSQIRQRLASDLEAHIQIRPWTDGPRRWLA